MIISLHTQLCHTWIFFGPGQCPASDCPPPVEHASVEMHSPLKPLLTLQALPPLGFFGTVAASGLVGITEGCVQHYLIISDESLS